jgi:hypothetical protein
MYDGHGVTKVTPKTFYHLKTMQHLLQIISNCGYFHTCTCGSPATVRPWTVGSNPARGMGVSVFYAVVTLNGQYDLREESSSFMGDFQNS